MKTIVTILAVLVPLSFAASSRADDPTAALAAPSEPDVPVVARPNALPPAPRPWLYLDDPTLPQPLTVVAYTRATVTKASAAAEPFAFDLVHRGGVLEAGAEVGILPWLSLTATGYGSDAGGSAAVIGGARFSLLPRGSSTHLVLGTGMQRDLSGTGAVWGTAAIEQDFGRARIGATGRFVHSFAPGRDAVDLVASAGASVQVSGPLRAGVEWTGQELEGIFDDDEAEGGVRQFLGPSASVELLEHRLALVGGPAFGLSHTAPSLVGRMSVAYAF